MVCRMGPGYAAYVVVSFHLPPLQTLLRPVFVLDFHPQILDSILFHLTLIRVSPFVQINGALLNKLFLCEK